MSWKENKCGKFSVRSPYASLARGGREPFLAIIVWNPWVQTEVGFFTWEVAWGRNYDFRSTQKKRLEFATWMLHEQRR